ncbi:hypothetical protein EU527_11200 [Candidatus Thorarchaeota archaeon]|nr:MAG: hypothetical protein EU527_11200 [Candidatus Thorarchaeota archaeon]
MVNESTPEERLRRYKEQLQKMAESENRALKLTNPVKTKEISHPITQPVKQTNPETKAPLKNPSPPQTLVSPSKRELRESMIVSSKSKREVPVSALADKESKNRIMLKTRIKAIDSKLQDIKSRKSMIELQFKRGMITQSEYQQRMEVLVSEGQELLREKAEIDKSFSH